MLSFLGKTTPQQCLHDVSQPSISNSLASSIGAWRSFITMVLSVEITRNRSRERIGEEARQEGTYSLSG